MKFSITFLFISVLVVCSSSLRFTSRRSNCHRVPALKTFDLKKFSGKWYGISQSSTAAQSNLKCSFYNITYVNSTRTNFTFSAKDIWSNKQMNTSGYMQQKYKYLPGIYVNGPPFPVNVYDNYTMVDVNYTSHVVIHVCRQNSILFDVEEVYILSRNRTLAPKTLQNAQNKLKTYGVNIYQFTAVDQIHC